MKKLLTVLALALITVVMALTVAGCGNTSAGTNGDLDALIERVEKLEKENNSLKNQINNLNVFWTDKKEYSSTETMTVYFGKTAVFKIRLDSFKWTGGKTSINSYLYLTSLCADILEDSIVTATCLSWDNGTYICPPSVQSTPPLIKQNVETRTARAYNGDEVAYNKATYFDFVVCVPGTPFELARFKNITVNK